MVEQGSGVDKKMKMTTLLAKYEKRFIDANVTKMPKWIEGWHLTLMTIIWSAGLILFGWLAKFNLWWLTGSSLMLFLQWFTDCFDGALGRHRDFGIPKWGFFMDHLLDFIFMYCVFAGYVFILTGINRDLVYLMGFVYAAFMVNSFLAFGATNEFKITYLGVGPTEVRIWFIVLNFLLAIFGVAWIEKIIPYLFIASIIVLAVVVFRSQKYIWKIDMENKKAKGPQNE